MPVLPLPCRPTGSDPGPGPDPEPGAECVTVRERCRCDDTNGDGIGDTTYTELYCITSDGAAELIGTYDSDDPSLPYTPVSPVDCDAGDVGAEPVTGVRAYRVVLDPGGTWDLDADGGLLVQSVTAHALNGADATVTTESGASVLTAGETASWSVIKGHDHLLYPPLTITAGTGRVAVSWTREVPR